MEGSLGTHLGPHLPHPFPAGAGGGAELEGGPRRGAAGRERAALGRAPAAQQPPIQHGRLPLRADLLPPPPAGAPLRHPPHPHLPPQRGPRGPRLPAPHHPRALGAHHPRHPRWAPRGQGRSAGGGWPSDPSVPAVLQDLLLQLDCPDPRRLLRPDVARELQERPEEFRRRAEEHTRLHAEPRPDPHA
ncbi:ubiquitin/ISG15-conjugating enzyme E2 L6 isoform X1 [Onychostruthus taczanowskii]|uniref:ubiquitin/ISG15-conjugating enzyme E2 L6 isoform X1 n=1 Tax=Onychostruthus taczanowskii TaxID=356909 RepID=UPI001B804079|nr:ubiquitin/ISG15-conjugating enzyme E2 L6 isoform X1 [Onychostruthus taczanowskii]